MTAYEYIDLAHSGTANAASTVMFGFTILSAYLIVSYIIGSKLTTSQVTAITVIYMVTYLFNTAAHVGMIDGAMEFTRLAKELSPDLDINYSADAPYVALFIRLSMFLISLWFMWDVRHPKTE